MTEVAKPRATECPVCLDDYEDPRVLSACGHSVCFGCVQQLIDASPSLTTVACPECREHSRIPTNGFPKNFRLSAVISEMQIGVACTSCQRKASLEDLFRCETCRAHFHVDNDQDVVLCGACAMKHSMASKTHVLVEHRMASKRDVEKAIKRIDEEPTVIRAYIIAAKAEGTESFAREANAAARKCMTKSKEIRDGLSAMKNLTRDKLELMTSKALRMKDAVNESQVAVRNALSVCNGAIISEIEKCNRVLQESNDVRADKTKGPSTDDLVPGTSADSSATRPSAASRLAVKRKMAAE